jgi:hypothetical protein
LEPRPSRRHGVWQRPDRRLRALRGRCHRRQCAWNRLPCITELRARHAERRDVLARRLHVGWQHLQIIPRHLHGRRQRVGRGRCGYLSAVSDTTRAVRSATVAVSGGIASVTGCDVDESAEGVACIAPLASRRPSTSSRALGTVAACADLAAGS